MITLELLQALCPKTNPNQLEQFVEALNQVCDYYEINTPERTAAFLAQVAHESGNFNFIKENLNYSAEGLNKIFKKYFPTLESAQPYARQPQKIASKVYANRMGNGPEETGDGYKFCGRGLIQLTGKNNYTLFANALGLSLEDTVAYMETPEGATASAGWFWDNNHLNQWVDKGDFITLTKRINGGTIGLEDRQHHFRQALQLLQG